MVTFDVSDLGGNQAAGLFEVSELDSPFSRTPGARFGAHQFHERMTGTLVYAVWFGGGPAHHRCRRSVRAARGRLFHSGARGGRSRAAEQRRGARRARPDLHGRPASRLRHSGIQRLIGARCRARAAIEIRRQVIRYARSIPAWLLRNYHRQVALSLRSLFKNRIWLDSHTLA